MNIEILSLQLFLYISASFSCEVMEFSCEVFVIMGVFSQRRYQMEIVKRIGDRVLLVLSFTQMFT